MKAKLFSFPVFQGVFRRHRKQPQVSVFQFSTPLRGGKTQKTENTMEDLLGLEFCRGCEGKLDMDNDSKGFLCKKLSLLMTWHKEDHRWIFLTDFSERDLVSLIKGELEKFS